MYYKKLERYYDEDMTYTVILIHFATGLTNRNARNVNYKLILSIFFSDFCYSLFVRLRLR